MNETQNVPLQPVVVDGYSLTVENIERVARYGAHAVLDDQGQTLERIRRSYQLNRQLVHSGKPVYGVTTGFGDSVNRQVGYDRAARMPAAQIRKNGCGRGPYLPIDQARAVVLVRANCLARGNSGVRPLLVENLLQLLNRDVTPAIREIGSVGASGDLIPGSYIAATLMGDRMAYLRDRLMPSRRALAEVGLEPLVLEPKEGLAMTNGTQFMTGIAALSVVDAEEIARITDICSAMAVEVLLGIDGSFHPFFTEHKRHPGLRRSTNNVRALLDNSRLARKYQDVVESLGVMEQGFRLLPVRIQDKYSLRCAPHFNGVLYDTCSWAKQWIETEVNSSNDNPLYDVESGLVHSGGNFTGGHIALAMDALRTAVASICDLVDRQFALLVDDKFNQGLTAGLIVPLPDDHPDKGIYHGFKGMQLLMSSITAEALQACMPMTVFSRSTAAHNQDKVSMGATAARKTRDVIRLAEEALAVHLIGLCQAADLRGADKLGRTQAVYEEVRKVSPFVERDRELEQDIENVVALIRSRAITRAVADVFDECF